MNWTEIIDALPKIIFYLASGFIFLHVFLFFAFKKPLSEDIQGKITLSLVIGFILKQLLSLIPVRFSFEVNYIILLCVSFLLAFGLAKLVQTKIFSSLLNKLGTGRTVNSNFWDDVIDSEMFIKVVNYSEEYAIIGLCSKVEEVQRVPQIVLEHYKIEDLSGDILENHIGNKNESIVVNLEKYDNVHIIYSKNSKNCSKVNIQDYEDNNE